MGDFATWNSEPAGGGIRRPWVYGITFRMPPPWWSRKPDRASLTVDREFYLQEIAGIYRYNFRLRIGVNGKWLSEKYLPSEYAVPSSGSGYHPIAGYPIGLSGDRVILCPAGGVLEVDALPPAKFHWRSNPISIRFIGQVAA